MVPAGSDCPRHMLCAPSYAVCMSSLQIRNVPDDVHRTLKARAARAGQSLSEFALAELARSASRPTMEELASRIRLRGPAGHVTPAAELVRAERDAR